MPKAEAGTPKAIANQMRRKGLQRLRWYCQVCEKQCPDDNGFKQHTMSEGHVRQMQMVGQNAGKVINDYSMQFKSDFIKLLRTAHGEKRVNMNHFYQEYIADKHHIHMNSTKWHSLTEFAKYLGREGVCRVDEEEPGESGRGGLFISWIDNSPEAMRRQDALKKKERQDRGDEEREQRQIRAQIKRAQKDKGLDDDDEADEEEAAAEKARELQRKEGEKIKLSFGPAKPSTTPKTASPPDPPTTKKQEEENNTPSNPPPPPTTDPSTAQDTSSSTPAPPSSTIPSTTATTLPPTKPKNIFSMPNSSSSTKKSNPLAAGGKKLSIQQQRPMSQAERIMKEEIERNNRKRANGGSGGGGGGMGGGKRLKM